MSYRNQGNCRDQPVSQVRVDLLTWTSASLSPMATIGESGGAVGGDVTSCSCSAGQAGVEPILGGADKHQKMKMIGGGGAFQLKEKP